MSDENAKNQTFMAKCLLNQSVSQNLFLSIDATVKVQGNTRVLGVPIGTYISRTDKQMFLQDKARVWKERGKKH